MSASEFRLEQVLRHAQRQEEQKQLELKSLAGEERRLRDQLASLRDRERAQIRSLIDGGRDGPIDPAEMDDALAYLDAIAGRIGERLGAVEGVKTRVTESREQLVELLKETRTLENLKQQAAAEAAADERRREARATDDLTSARFARRRREG